MIRRDITLPDGRPGWALISQVEHARIAWEAARAWNTEAFPLATPHEELLAAVLHHDDGWLAWELRPTVVEGKPRDFMEMPLDESLAIWRRSIAVAQTCGPLAAYAVGSHFAALSRWSLEKGEHSESWRDLAEEFIEEQDELAAERLAELVARDGGSQADLDGVVATAETRRNADRAWHALQFFDRVSLWLCCAERREAETIDVPESLGTGLGAFRFEPCGAGAGAGADGGAVAADAADAAGVDRAEIAIRPWPLREDRLELTTMAAGVPREAYGSPDSLARAERTPLRLEWMLRRR